MSDPVQSVPTGVVANRKERPKTPPVKQQQGTKTQIGKIQSPFLEQEKKSQQQLQQQQQQRVQQNPRPSRLSTFSTPATAAKVRPDYTATRWDLFSTPNVSPASSPRATSAPESSTSSASTATASSQSSFTPSSSASSSVSSSSSSSLDIPAAVQKFVIPFMGSAASSASTSSSISPTTQAELDRLTAQLSAILTPASFSSSSRSQSPVAPVRRRSVSSPSTEESFSSSSSSLPRKQSLSVRRLSASSQGQKSEIVPEAKQAEVDETVRDITDNLAILKAHGVKIPALEKAITKYLQENELDAFFKSLIKELGTKFYSVVPKNYNELAPLEKGLILKALTSNFHLIYWNSISTDFSSNKSMNKLWELLFLLMDTYQSLDNTEKKMAMIASLPKSFQKEKNILIPLFKMSPAGFIAANPLRRTTFI